MAKYRGVGGFRIGKVGNEKYYLRNNENLVQEVKKYIPINSNWLNKEDFKNYVLSLLQEGIPQVYALNEVPEDIYPYALLFIQNDNSTEVYLDKDGERTQFHISGGGFEPTQSQLDAMNSGIDTAKREGYDQSVIAISGLDTRITTAEDTLDAIENALEYKADKSTTYTKTETDNLLVDKLNKRTTGNVLNVYSHIGAAQGEMEVLTSLSQDPLDTTLLSEKAIYNLVYKQNLVIYDQNTGYEGIFTQLNVPENSSKSGYLVNFNPAIIAGASRNEGYITAYNRNAGTKLIEFITYDIYEKWYVLKKNGVWGNVKSALSYRHTLIRYNNDNHEYPMGWCIIINDNPSMTFADVKTWLADNGYTSVSNSYWYCGGCCGTTGVRNKEDTGTAYVGRVCSGIFIDTGTDNVYFKYDYNGTVQVLESRCVIKTTH